MFAEFGNYVASGLWNREVCAIEGAQVLEVTFRTLLLVHYKEAVRHSRVSIRRDSTVPLTLFSVMFEDSFL